MDKKHKGRPFLALPFYFTPKIQPEKCPHFELVFPQRVRTLSRKRFDSLSDYVEFHSRSVTHSGRFYGVKLRNPVA